MEDREIEKSYSLGEFITELRRLADTLEADGNFSIELEGEQVMIPESAIASIAYEIEDGRAEIEFQMTWEVESADDDEDEAVEMESRTEDEAKSEATDETEAAA